MKILKLKTLLIVGISFLITLILAANETAINLSDNQIKQLIIGVWTQTNILGTNYLSIDGSNNFLTYGQWPRHSYLLKSKYSLTNLILTYKPYYAFDTKTTNNNFDFANKTKPDLRAGPFCFKVVFLKTNYIMTLWPISSRWSDGVVTNYYIRDEPTSQPKHL